MQRESSVCIFSIHIPKQYRQRDRFSAVIYRAGDDRASQAPCWDHTHTPFSEVCKAGSPTEEHALLSTECATELLDVSDSLCMENSYTPASKPHLWIQMKWKVNIHLLILKSTCSGGVKLSPWPREDPRSQRSLSITWPRPWREGAEGHRQVSVHCLLRGVQNLGLPSMTLQAGQQNTVVYLPLVELFMFGTKVKTKSSTKP